MNHDLDTLYDIYDRLSRSGAPDWIKAGVSDLIDKAVKRLEKEENRMSISPTALVYTALSR